MAGVKFTNFASTTIATAVIAPGDLSFSVAAASGNLFPTIVPGEWFYIVLVDVLSAPTKREVVKVTARSVDVMTIVRAQEGTTAQSWITGNFCACRPTNQGLIDLITTTASAVYGVLSSALVNFLQAGAGAVSRTVQDKERDVISVLDYAANGVSGVPVDPTGVVDSTLGIQAAITAAYGKKLYAPGGTYKLTAGLSITSGLTFEGAGRDETIFSWTSTTLNVVSIATNTAVHFRDMWFQGPALGTAGAIINLTGGAGANAFSSFTRMLFSGGYDHFKTVAALAWTLNNCYFSACLHRAVTVSNTNNVDAGDSLIHGNCVFSNSGAGSVCIYQVSSGGLKVIGNKFNQASAIAYQMQLASGAFTSDLLFVGNSIENQTTAAMLFATDGGGATFSNVVICNNQMALNPVGLDLSSATAFLSNVNINGNTIALAAAGTFGVNIGNVTKFSVTENLISGVGGTLTGINIASTATKGRVSPNQYVDLTVNIANAALGIILAEQCLLASGGTAVAAGADTTEDVLATITVPAKQMGKNGTLKVRASFNITNGGNSKTMRVRYSTIGGTAVWSTVQTAVDYVTVDLIISNLNLTNSQSSDAIAFANGAVIAVASVASAIDTTADTTIVITGQKASAGDALILTHYVVEMIRN